MHSRAKIVMAAVFPVTLGSGPDSEVLGREW